MYARVSGSSTAADLSFALDHRDDIQHLQEPMAAEQPALPRLTEEEALAVCVRAPCAPPLLVKARHMRREVKRRCCVNQEHSL